MDRRGRDQFVIRYGDETEVSWNDHQKALAEQVSISTQMHCCIQHSMMYAASLGNLLARRRTIKRQLVLACMQLLHYSQTHFQTCRASS